MKRRFRQSMAWLHTWAGLVGGAVLYFIFVTGTMGYFDNEIDRWMQPERPLAAHAPALGDSISVAVARLSQQAPRADRWTIYPPGTRENRDLRILWHGSHGTGSGGRNGDEILDPASGRPVVYRATGGGQRLYQMHYALHYVPLTAAIWFVGVCAMAMLVVLITGVITHRRFFKDFFTFRPGTGQRSWLDAHSLAGVMTLPFALMITYSGLLFFMETYMPFGISVEYAPEERRAFTDYLFPADVAEPEATLAPLAPLVPLDPLVREVEWRWGSDQVRTITILHPGSAAARIVFRRHEVSPVRGGQTWVFHGANGESLRLPADSRDAARAVHDTFLGLHEGLFAGWALRWLYFGVGVLGCAMIATGLVLWTVKRRTRQAGTSTKSFGFRLVESLNIGTIVGLLIGIAAYFWANRLLPVGMAHRADWEMHCLFIAWGVMLLWASIRPAGRAWVDELSVAAVAFGALPLLNALTTDRHLGVTIPAGDWVLAGVDLTVLVIGLLFAAAAFTVRRSGAAPASAARRVRATAEARS